MGLDFFDPGECLFKIEDPGSKDVTLCPLLNEILNPPHALIRLFELYLKVILITVIHLLTLQLLLPQLFGHLKLLNLLSLLFKGILTRLQIIVVIKSPLATGIVTLQRVFGLLVRTYDSVIK